MAPHFTTLLIMTIGLGTIVTCSSWHWLFTWVGLEINTLAIIPLMVQNTSPRSTEATTKYVLIQSAATGMFMYAMLLNANMTPEWTTKLIEDPTSCVLMLLAIVMKLGLAPFHYWLSEVLQGLDLMTGLILSTLQKMAPFAVLLQINYTSIPGLAMLFGLSSIVAGLAGLNQVEVRKILAYSSTAHMGWIMLIVSYYPSLATLYFIIYVIMTSSVFYAFNELESKKISTFARAWSKKPILAVILILTLLSLGGLPPLTGFMPKWLILNEMMAQALSFPTLVATIGTLANISFYLRLCYLSSIVFLSIGFLLKSDWRTKTKRPAFTWASLASAALTLLPLTPLFYVLAKAFFY